MYHPILHKVGWLNGENCDVLLWLSQWLGIDHTKSIQLHKRKRGKRRRLWLTRTRKKGTKQTQHRSRWQPTWPCPIKLVNCGKIFCYRELICRQNIFGDVSVFSRNNLQPNKKRISGQATMKSSLKIKYMHFVLGQWKSAPQELCRICHNWELNLRSLLCH